MGNFEPVAHLAPPYGLVVEVDGDTGDIVSSLHSTNGAVRFISEAYVHDRWSARNMKILLPQQLNYLQMDLLRFALQPLPGDDPKEAEDS